MSGGSGLELSVVRSQDVPSFPDSYIVSNPGTGSILLVCPSQPAVYVLEPSNDAIYGPIYLQSQVGIRRDLGGTNLYKTALQLAHPESEIALELTNAEAEKLAQYLKDGSVKFGPISEKVHEQLKKSLDEGPGSKWKTHVVVGWLEELWSLLKGIVEEETKKGSAVLPLASAVRERLDLMRAVPYNLDFNVDSQNEGFDKAVMASEIARRTTFAHWPHIHYKWALPDQMAEAGFFHQPSTTGDDRVNCFACKVCLVCWEPADEPWSEHERHSPSCSFVRGEMTQNIPLSVSQASVPATPHLVDRSILSLGSVVSSDWAPVLFQGGLIQLWHLTALPKEPVNFTIDMNDHYVGMKTGYVRSQQKKSNRVTFSDDSGEQSAFIVSEALAEVIPGTLASAPEPETVSDWSCGSEGLGEDVVRATAVCCCGGRTSLSYPGPKSKAAMAENKCSDALIVGLELNESKLIPQPKRQASNETDPIVEALNSVNRSGEVQIEVPDSASGEEGDVKRKQFHPFVLVYKIDESPSELKGMGEDSKSGGKRKARIWEDTKNFCLQNPVPIFEAPMKCIGIGMEEEGESSEGVSVEEELNELPLEDWTADLDPANNNAALIDSILHGAATSEVPVPPGSFAQAPKPSFNPPRAQMIVLQCFRLPPQLDEPDWSFHSILGSLNGSGVVFLLHREFPTPAAAILIYRLSFTGMMTGLVEQAARVHFFPGLSFRDAVLVPGDVVGLETTDTEVQDCIALLDKQGHVHMVNLENGQTLYQLKEKSYKSIARAAGDKLCAMTETSAVDLLQINPGMKSEDSFERTLFQIDTDPGENGPDISEVSLMEMWELIKSDWTSTTSFSCEPPPFWNEVHQHQRLRKNPQHYLKEERLARCWQLSASGNSWKEQFIELTLPSKVSASHIDLRFVFHQLCHGIPDIEVTLFSRPFRSENFLRDGTDSMEVVFGPAMLSQSLDLTSNSGLLQMTHPVLQSSKHRKFLIRLRALTEESEGQRLWRISQQEYIQSTWEMYEKSQHLAYVQEQSRAAKAGKYPGTVKEVSTALKQVSQFKALDGKKNVVERKGCDWLQEIALTVWKTKTNISPKARTQRLCLMRNQAFHELLLTKLLAGEGSSESLDRFHQLMAFDIASWLFAHWHTGQGPSLLSSFSRRVMQNMQQLLRSCYLYSTRTISHKCSAFFAAILNGLKTHDAELCRALISCILSEVRSLLGVLPEFRSSGSLSWCISLVSSLIRTEPSINISVHFITDCVATLRELSKHMVQKEEIATLLKTKYGLSGIPMELEMFEVSPPVLQLVQRSSTPQQFTYANVTGGLSSSSQFAGGLGEDELDWGQLLQFEINGGTEQTGGVNHDPVTGISCGFAPRSYPRPILKRQLLSREHCLGLLDAEPLPFLCSSGSDGLKVENVETGQISGIISDASNGSSGQGPIPLPEVAQTDAAPSGNPSVANAVSSMKQQVQTILSKQMQLLALQQQKQKLQAALSNPVDVSVTPGTQGSSASTFGVPTTPKTTPFMTPTPLSPMHLSPFNSEPNLNMTIQPASDEEAELLQPHYPPAPVNLIPATLMALDTLKPPANHVLIVDRMNSGARKFVVLDFGRPILLTDLVIPSCGDINSISVDSWVGGESVDGQRLLVCNNIAEKNLVISDLDPPPLCRYLKMTYIGKQGLGNSHSCRISLGNFYGYKFILPWQLAYSAEDLSESDRMSILQPPVSRRHLEQLSEDLRCKHHLSARQLRRLVEDGADEVAVKEEYKECALNKLQWNLVQKVRSRLDPTNGLVRESPLPWDSCPQDQIRTCADILLSCVIRCAPYLNIIEPSLAIPIPLLDFESATFFFERFCMGQSAKLQALCCLWLFQHGCGTEWWGKFLEGLLERYLGRSAEPSSLTSENLFLLISFLTAHSIRNGNTQVMADLLSLALRTLTPKCPEKGVDGTLLSWVLYVLSVGFDVVVKSSSRRRNDRWGFLARDMNSGDTNGADKESLGRRQTGRKVPKLKWSDTTGGMGISLALIEQQYHKQLEVADDIKKYIGEHQTLKTVKSSKKPKDYAGSTASITSKSSSSSSSKRTKSSRKRSRSSVKLRLPSQLCLEVAQKLSNLLLDNFCFLNPSASLVGIKVLSKICTYSSSRFILLSQFLGAGGTEKIVRIGLSSGRFPWAQHAVLCFLLDVLDAEHKIGLARDPRGTTEKPGMLGVSQVSLPGAASTSTTPDTPNSAQLAIESILSSIQPTALPDSPASLQLRTKSLQSLGREMIHSSLSGGYPFSQINVWVQSAKEQEHSVAAAATTEEQYKENIEKQIQIQKNSKVGMYESFSGLVALTQASLGGVGGIHSPAYVFPSPIPPPSSFNPTGPPPPFSPWLGGMASGYNPPAGLAEAKEKLSKLCEQLQLSSNAPLMSLGLSSGPPPPGFGPTPSTPSGDSAAALGMESNLDTTMGGDDASASGESGVNSPAQTEGDDASRADPALPHHSRIYLDIETQNRLACLQIELQRSVFQLQPISLVVDERLESQPRWGAEVCCRRWLMEDDTLIRMALHSMPPLKKPTPLARDESLIPVGEQSSAELVSHVLSSFFLQLTPYSPGEHVDNLLHFFWSLVTGSASETEGKANRAIHWFLDSVKNKLGDASTLNRVRLSVRAIENLLSYLAKSGDLINRSWTLAVRILTTLAGVKEEGVALGLRMVESAHFAAFLERYVMEGGSCGNTTAGPAVADALSNFLNRLRIHCDVPGKDTGKQLKKSVFDVLVTVSRQASRSISGRLPCAVDLLSHLVDFLIGQDLSSVPTSILGEVMVVTSQLARRYLATSSPVTTPTLLSGIANPRYCFQVGAPDRGGTDFRTFSDRTDVVLCSMLKLCYEFSDHVHLPSFFSEFFEAPPTPLAETRGSEKTEKKNGPSVLDLMEPEAVESCVRELLAALSFCHCNISKAGSGLGSFKPNFDSTTLISVADWVMVLLKRVFESQARLEGSMQSLVRYLEDSLTQEGSSGLSPPTAAFVLNILEAGNGLENFLKYGGEKVLVEQMKSSLGLPLLDVRTDQGELIKKLAAVSTQVLGQHSSSPSRKLPDAKIDGMTNFSPICQIMSTSPMAHHLNALLTSTPPHRRARTAAWTYHFYPAELWLDLTLTLPHPVLLKEIQIRPHLPSLQTGPSAVQVELASDTNATSFTLLGPPLITTGSSKIRIPTDGYNSLVSMVKIHVKRPPDSTNMGMSQIMLLGHSPLSNSAHIFGGLEAAPQFSFWLDILGEVLEAEKSGGAELRKGIRSALLPQLVQVFLSRPMSAPLMASLRRLLFLLDSTLTHLQDQPHVLGLITQHIKSGQAVLHTSLPWVVDLMDALCRSSDSSPPQKLLSTRFALLVEMVSSTMSAHLTKEGKASETSETVLAHLLMLCACIYWREGSTNQMLQSHLVDFPGQVRNLCGSVSGKSWKSLGQAAGWMLCSIARAVPKELDAVGEMIGLGEGEEIQPQHLWVLSSALMSAPAADHLVSDLPFSQLLNRLITLLSSQELSPTERDEVVELVKLMAEAATQNPVKDFLANSEGKEFLRKYMALVCSSQIRNLGLSLASVVEQNFIGMIQNLLPSRPDHQELFSQLLCESIEKLGLEGLNGTLQEITLCTLLEDERVSVLQYDHTALDSTHHDKRQSFLHPKYGSSLKRTVFKASIFATVASLFPEKAVGVRGSEGRAVSGAGEVPEGWPLPTPSSAWLNSTNLSTLYLHPQQSAPPGQEKLNPGIKVKGWSGKQGPTPVDSLISYAVLPSQPLHCLPGSLTLGQTLQLSSQTDFLHISIFSAEPTKIPPIATHFLKEKGPTSTVEVFASKGGLAILAQHLQLYQPSSAMRRSKNVDKDGNVEQGNKQLMTAYAESFDTSYDPFEFVDMTTSSVGLGLSGPATTESETRKERMRNLLNTGLPPHIVVSFSVFLRLDGYAELLIKEDRERAQKLLRLAMGAPPESGLPSGSNTDFATLALLPFMTLFSLYEQQAWSSPEGKIIRDISMELGIPQLLLVCLAAFSHHEPRSPDQTRPMTEAVRLVEQLLPVKEKSFPTTGGGDQVAGQVPVPTSTADRGHQYWAKGTGFGTGSTQQQWNVDLHVLKRKQDEENVTCLLNVLAAFICPSSAQSLSEPVDNEEDAFVTLPVGIVPTDFLDLLRRSCVVPALVAYLRNDSVLDIARHTSVYEAVLRLLAAFALAPPLGSLLGEVVEEEGFSPGAMLNRLNDCIQVYASKLKPIGSVKEVESEEEEGEGENEQEQQDKAEEGLLKLVPLVKRATQLCVKCIGEAGGGSGDMGAEKRMGCEGDLMEWRYRMAMEGRQFDSVNFFSEAGGMLVPFHYESSVRGSKDSGSLAPRVRRLAQEAVTLSTSLPLAASSSVFVRTAEERLDLMKVLITGPSDTPYCNGCFEFDVWFPPEYPSSPMHINLCTTGGGSVRFNPNLYNDGKVCLSVLNTWHGRPEERWNPHNSSFLQVLVSIQSLILVPDPYFNEPGYERSRNTAAGQQASREYDANLRQATVRWAMLEMVRNPPSSFKDVILRHFWLKREEISFQVEGWIAEMEEFTLQANGKQSSRSISGNLTALKRYYHQLSEEFKKMKCPEGLEEVGEKEAEPGEHPLQ